MQLRFRGRLWLWGALCGAVGGILDTAVFLSLGIDFHVAGRNMTGFVAVYLAISFALLCAAVGWFVDARARARRDARTIREQVEALEQTRRAAAQNEKLAAIGRLAAGVAHEVRNPLGVIRASASMVQEGFEPDSESHRACRFICEEIDRLNGLITALLNFARPSPPRLRTLSLEQVLDRALTLHTGELGRRRIDLARQLDPGTPELVGDPDLLAQLVLGLVTNAAEAVGRDGRIELRVGSDGDAVRCEVADSGPGIPEDAEERVFEPFYTTKDAGTGLGLAMTARIAHVHGGHIRVLQGRGAGTGGSGACFRVELPVAGPALGAAA